MTVDPSYEIEATATSVEILEYLVDAGGRVGVSEVAADLDISKSMAYNHLSTLRDLGYVVKRDRQYASSLRPMALGERTRRAIPVYRQGRDEVENLSNATDEVAELFIMEEHYGVPASIANATGGWTSPHTVGERMPLHVNAPGKALLASLPPDRAATLLDDRPLSAPTDQTVTDPDELKKEVREIRESGVAFCREEQYEGVVGIGAPVEVPEPTCHAALAVVGPDDRLYGRYYEEDLVGQVVSTAKAIEVALTE